MEEFQTSMDIDKAWHGLHFLLTGYVLEYYEMLKPFLAQGASHGYGLIVFLN